jgi:hypothetical protein
MPPGREGIPREGADMQVPELMEMEGRAPRRVCEGAVMMD